MPIGSYIDISMGKINVFRLRRITTACLCDNEMNICKASVTEFLGKINVLDFESYQDLSTTKFMRL